MRVVLLALVFQLAQQVDDRPEWEQLCTVLASADDPSGDRDSMRCIWFSGKDPSAWFP